MQHRHRQYSIYQSASPISANLPPTGSRYIVEDGGRQSIPASNMEATAHRHATIQGAMRFYPVSHSSTRGVLVYKNYGV
jgi:hypothetical protein